MRHADLNGGLRLARAPSLAFRGAGGIDVPLQAMQRVAHDICAALQVPKLALQKRHLLTECMVGRRLHGRIEICLSKGFNMELFT